MFEFYVLHFIDPFLSVPLINVQNQYVTHIAICRASDADVPLVQPWNLCIIKILVCFVKKCGLSVVSLATFYVLFMAVGCVVKIYLIWNKNYCILCTNNLWSVSRGCFVRGSCAIQNKKPTTTTNKIIFNYQCRKKCWILWYLAFFSGGFSSHFSVELSVS